MKDTAFYVSVAGGALLLFGIMAADVVYSEVNQAKKEISSSVEWEYDYQRAEAARLDAQRKFAEEFARTNTDPRLSAMIEPDFGRWKPIKGQRELGYRNDGAVVWRFVPESNAGPQK